MQLVIDSEMIDWVKETIKIKDSENLTFKKNYNLPSYKNAYYNIFILLGLLEYFICLFTTLFLLSNS